MSRQMSSEACRKLITARILCFAIGIAAALATPAVARSAEVNYKILARFEGATALALNRAVISPDGKNIAVPYQAEQEEYVSINGVPQKRYQKIVSRSAVWSGDSTSFAFVGERDGQQYLVRNGLETPIGGRLQSLGFSTNPAFSFDGKALLWIAASKDGMQLFIDGKSAANRERLYYARFREPTASSMYLAQADCRSQVVDSEYGPHDVFLTVGLPKFSGSINAYLYQARSATDYLLIRQDKTVLAKSPEEFLYFTMSPDGTRVLYMEQVLSAAVDKTRVQVTGLEPSDFIGARSSSGTAAFSPDSKRVLYTVADEEDYRVVIDGNKLGSWHFVSMESLAWSPNSKRYAYVAGDEKAGVFVMTDLNKFGRYTNVVPQSLTFSADGNIFAYVATSTTSGTASSFFVVTNGKNSSKKYEEIRRLLVLPSGRSAYLARTASKFTVVVGDKSFPLDVDQAYDKYMQVSKSGGLEILVRKGVEFRVASVEY